MNDVSDPAIRKLTAEILSRSEFYTADDKVASWTWILRLLRLLDKIQTLRHSSPGLYWCLLITLLIACAGLIVYVVRSLSLVMTVQESTPRLHSTNSSSDPLAEADRMAAAGCYLHAAHTLMIASFEILARRSIIELRPDRPNRWIRDALQNSRLVKSLADDINTLVVQTEYRWFGGRRDDPDIYSQWLSAFKRLSETAK